MARTAGGGGHHRTAVRNSRAWRTTLPVTTIFSLSFLAYAKYDGTGEGLIDFALEKSELLAVRDSPDVGG